MPDTKRTIWTPTRRAMGNLLPALFVVPPMAMGAMIMIRGLQRTEIGGPDPLWQGLTWFGGGIAAGWIALNFLGLYQNGKMRREMSRRVGEPANRRNADPSTDPVFVGMATPGYHSIVDPHEDVGFLIFGKDSLEYHGEAVRVMLHRRDIRSVSFRANAHTLAGLGRWIAVEGKVGGKPVRLLIEPRERPTLLGNLFYGKALRQRIEMWRSLSA